MKKERIVILCETYPPEFSGAGKRIMTQAHFLGKLGYNLCIITQTKDPINRDERVKAIWIGKTARYTKEWKKVLAVPGLVVRIIRKLPKDAGVIHCVSGATSLYTLSGIIAGKLLRKRVLVGTTLVGADDPLTVKNSSFGRIRNILLRMADGYISISPQLLQLHLKAELDEELCYMIPNSVDTERFISVDTAIKEALRFEMGYEIDELIFLTVGAISQRKGTLGMIESLITASDQQTLNRRIRFLCIGPQDTIDGSPQYLEKIKRRIGQNTGNVTIELLGEKGNIDQYMQISDCFLFNSEAEGFGNVLIEAQASGLLVMSRRLKGITDYIINEGLDGYIFDDLDALVNLLRAYLSDEHDYIGSLAAYARNNVLGRFSHEVVAKEYLKAYKL